MEERLSLGDILGIWSLLLGYENLSENRQQSRHNDVIIANDNQAQYLLTELGRKFDEQNTMLKEILERLEMLENEGNQGDSGIHRG